MPPGELNERLAEIERLLDALEARSFINYSKGSYTPTLVGGTTAGTTTYTFQDGRWRRVGPLVFVWGQINWTAATGTGEQRYSLPFAAVSLNFTGSQRLSGVTFANGSVELLCSPPNSYFVLDSPLTNGATTRVQMEAAGQTIWSFFYLVQG